MEKRQTFRLGKAIFFFSAFFAAMALVFVACQRDFNAAPLENADKPLTAKVEAAKKWFEAQQEIEGPTVQLMKPQWNKAFSVHNVVEVPFMLEGKFRVPSLYKDLRRQGRQRLVIYDNGKAERTAYIINYMPSETFQGNITDINAINFRYKKFSGRLAVYSLKKLSFGQFVYENGRFQERRSEITGTVANLLGAEAECESSVEYECTILNGCLFCSDVVVITCDRIDPDPCNGATPPSWCGADPCNSASPPSWCSNDPCASSNPPPYCSGNDPCDGPNPPPYCGGGDPCSGPNPPPECNGGCQTQVCRCEQDPSLPECGCPDKTNQYATDHVGTYSRGIYGVVRCVARITNVSIKGTTYTVSPMEFQLRQSENSPSPPIIPSVFSFTESSAGYDNDLNEQTCTRTIRTGHYGLLTHTFEAEVSGVVVKSTATYNWGQFIGNWTFN